MMAVTRIPPAKTSPTTTGSNAVKTPSNQRYFVPTDMPAIAQLWLFRLLIKHGDLHTYLLQEQLINEPNLASLGLSQQILRVKKPGMVKFILQAKCRELAADPKVGIPHELASNIFDLAVVVGLNHFEQQLLALAVLLSTNDVLRSYASQLHVSNFSCLEKTLQSMLDCPTDELKAALSDKGALISCGLLSLQIPCSLDDAFDFITPKLATELQQAGTSPLLVLRHLWQPAPLSTLHLSHFAHLQTELQILLPYLKQAVADRKVGVNVLLYGPPGTGKTQLARLMSSLVVGQTYQISSEDEDGDGITGGQRLRAHSVLSEHRFW